MFHIYCDHRYELSHRLSNLFMASVCSADDQLKGLSGIGRRSFNVNYRDQFKNRLNQLKSENRYRSFVELERHVGRHPYATWNSPIGPRDVVIWCSNDYLGMGQTRESLTPCNLGIVNPGSWWHPQHFWNKYSYCQTGNSAC